MYRSVNTINDPLKAYYFQPDQQCICDSPVTSITCDNPDRYSSVIQRFFSRHYHVTPGEEAAPYQVLFHSNRVCLICLAPEHPALKDGIASLNFNIGNMDRSKNSVRGKGKRGGMVLQSDSTLAILTSQSGTSYKIPSCIRGKLVEVNTNLSDHPELFYKFKDVAVNYLAVILPKLEHCDSIKLNLLTEAQYLTKINSR